MAIYEYKCQSCGHEFEELIRFGQANEISCPVCQSEQTARLLSKIAKPVGSSNAGHACSAAGCCGGYPGSCQGVCD